MREDADVTVVVTSCNRHDLLARTLESFRRHESEGRIARILVVEDGDADPKTVCEKFGAEYFCTGSRVGQIKAIDQAYGKVTTPYIFHLEDDWEFSRPGFMEKSRALMEKDAKLLTVQLRPWQPIEKLTFVAPDESWALVDTAPGTPWHGFSFHPSLRRLSDYKLLGSFAGQRLTVPLLLLTNSAAVPYEAEASDFYFRKGFYTAILDRPGYYRHIGVERHVTHSADFKNPPASLPPDAPCPCGSGRKYKDCHGMLT